MNNEKDLGDLNSTIETGYVKISKHGNARLANLQDAISSTTKELLAVYSNDMRNLGIVAGTVAPFSLTLLGANQFDINNLALMFGFSFLLYAIILSQFFLFRLSDAYEHRTSRAEISWVFAQFGLWQMEDVNNDSTKRINGMFDYQKRTREVEGHLGLNNTPSPHLLVLRKKLRSYNLITLLLVTSGIILILGSVVINPISAWIIINVYNP
ncbi:MAG: hypothetical protein K8Q91_01245 [Candidatus Vogelbacteria bacterium]|nr:hypothetical protein [Candidatus Vogelbacteria bacterium]